MLAIRELVDDVVIVSEDEMLVAIRYLALEEYIAAEPAGAAATAAMLHGKFEYGSRVVLLVTGAKVAPDIFRAAICSR